MLHPKKTHQANTPISGPGRTRTSNHCALQTCLPCNLISVPKQSVKTTPLPLGNWSWCFLMLVPLILGSVQKMQAQTTFGSSENTYTWTVLVFPTCCCFVVAVVLFWFWGRCTVNHKIALKGKLIFDKLRYWKLTLNAQIISNYSGSWLQIKGPNSRHTD